MAGLLRIHFFRYTWTVADAQRMLAGALGLPPEVLGDLILVASAGLWSMVMIRQSRHAPNFPAVDLGTLKVGSPDGSQTRPTHSRSGRGTG